MTRIGNVVVLTFGFGGLYVRHQGVFARLHGGLGPLDEKSSAPPAGGALFVFYHFKGGNEPIWKHRLNCRGGRKPT